MFARKLKVPLTSSVLILLFISLSISQGGIQTNPTISTTNDGLVELSASMSPNINFSFSSGSSFDADPLNPADYPIFSVTSSDYPLDDSWTQTDYITSIEGIFDTLNYFNLSKYGGGWQYEVTRDWSGIAFTYGKYILQDSECIIGLLSAFNLTRESKYLEYAEAIWNWDQSHFLDDVYGGYYVRLNQDNSIAIGDKGMFEHGWYGLATALLYIATGNSTYLNQVASIYSFVTDNFYDVTDGSYYGALSRDLGVSVSDVDTNWCAPYSRFLMTAYYATGNLVYHDKAVELVDNMINHAYDSQYGWIVNRVTSDWSSFSNPAKGWYDVLQTFIDAYRILGDPAYLTFAHTCFDDIQQANSSAGYLMEMNRDWTSSVNNELQGEEDPGTAIAYLRIANALQNSTILREAYRYRDAIYTGLHDPVYGGIYRRIYAGGSQSTWKQWCGAGRVMEMLAEYALITSSVDDTLPPTWGVVPVNQQLVHGESLSYQLYATDISGIGGWSVNDTLHFHITETGLLTNATALDIGKHFVNISVWDVHDNELWCVISVAVIPYSPTTSTTTTTQTTTPTTTPTENADDLLWNLLLIGSSGVTVIALIIIIVEVRRRS